MAERNNNKIEIPTGDRRSWHLNLAFALGKTAHKISNKTDKAKAVLGENLDTAKESFKYGLNHAQGQTMPPRIRRLKTPETPEEQISPILKEVKVIADISGLTKAIQEMNVLSLQHANDPAFSRLISKIEQLSSAEQEVLAKKFMDRLSASPYFNNAMNTFPRAPAEMKEEDCQKVVDIFVQCVSGTLEDIGLIPQEREYLLKLSDDMTQPLNDLIQFYLKPKTFSQNIKRLWNLQRIFMKTIKLIRETNALASGLKGSDLTKQQKFVNISI